VPHAPLGIARDSIAVATVDMATLFALFPDARTEIESDLGVPSGSLQSLERFGYDGKRGMTIAMPPLTDDARKLADDIRPIAESHAPSPQSMDLAMKTLKVASTAVRTLFPATDAKKLSGALGDLLGKNGWHAQGHDGSVFTMRHAIAELSDDGSWVALDVAIGSDHPTLESLHAAFANARETPPSLDGLAFRSTCDPMALARFGMLLGITKTAGAISGAGIDASQRERILVQGMWEASRLFALAGDGAFDRLDLSARASPFETTLRAHEARFSAPPAAWADAPSARIEGATLTLDASRGFVAAFGPTTDLVESIRDAGAFGFIVGFPREIVSAPLLAPKATHTPAPSPAAMDHFERAGISWTASHEPVYVGLLPATTTRANAECALATKTPCDSKHKLTLGAVKHIDEGDTKLVTVDKRFVVLISREAAGLASPVKISPAGPLRAELDTAAIAPMMHAQVPLPPHLSASVSNDAGALVIRLHP
jgi:hypothetical protein